MASMQTTELLVPYAGVVDTYTISILLPFLGICIVGLRVYTRVLQKWKFGIDDWLILPALTCVIAMGITLIIGVHGGAVAHPTPFDANLTPEEELTAVNPTIELLGKVQFTFVLLFVVASGFTKLSIAFFYRRLFVARTGSPFDWAIRLSVTVVVLWLITFFFGTLFVCGTHISASWGSVQDQATCTAALDIDNAFVVSDLVTNILIFCLPLPVIWNLQMTLGRKLTVIGILATGSISIVAAIIKIIISFEISAGGFTVTVDPDRSFPLSPVPFDNYPHPADHTYPHEVTVSTILLWIMIEAGLAIIAACLPTLRFLVGKVSLDTMMNSVRSAFSLRSLRSTQHSQPSSSPSGGMYLDLDGSRSGSSRTKMVSEIGTTEVVAMEAPVMGEIHVTEQMEQWRSPV